MVEQWDLLTAEERAYRLAERKVAAAVAQRGTSKVVESAVKTVATVVDN